MKKFYIMLVLALVTLLPACCVHNNVKQPQPLTVPTVESMMQTTVALVKWVGVTGVDEDGDPEYGEVDPEKDPKAELRSYCAGVWIDRDVILTAEHCVHDLGQPKEDPLSRMFRMLRGLPEPEWDPTGQLLYFSMYGEVRDESSGKKWRSSHRAKVLKVDPDHDLALVKVDPDEELRTHPVAALATNVTVGEDVQVIGHPSSLWWTLTRGFVSQIRPHADGPKKNSRIDVLQISAPIWFGNSGGGAFNAQGQLVGISSFMRRGPNLAFFVDHQTIRTFLANNGFRR